MLGNHLVKHWSVTQATVALSSAEAELYGVIRGTTQGLGLLALGRDLGEEFELEIATDSSAAQGICKRQGLGKVRHLDTNLLWIQEKVRSGEVILSKVHGPVNPGDLLTKHLTQEAVAGHLGRLGCYGEPGRAQSAPALVDAGFEGESIMPLRASGGRNTIHTCSTSCSVPVPGHIGLNAEQVGDGGRGSCKPLCSMSRVSLCADLTGDLRAPRCPPLHPHPPRAPPGVAAWRPQRSLKERVAPNLQRASRRRVEPDPSGEPRGGG